MVVALVPRLLSVCFGSCACASVYSWPPVWALWNLEEPLLARATSLPGTNQVAVCESVEEELNTCGDEVQIYRDDLARKQKEGHDNSSRFAVDWRSMRQMFE